MPLIPGLRHDKEISIEQGPKLEGLDLRARKLDKVVANFRYTEMDLMSLFDSYKVLLHEVCSH